MTYRSNEVAAREVAETVQNLGRQQLSFQVDLNDFAAVSAAVAEAQSSFGVIHTLVHAAGPFVPQQYLAKISPEQFAEQCSQDIVGFFNLLHAASKHLRNPKAVWWLLQLVLPDGSPSETCCLLLPRVRLRRW